MMERIGCAKGILCLLFVVIMSTSAWGMERGAAGFGVVLGDPIGPNLSYWLSHTGSFDVGIGFQEDTVVYADYLWHGWDLIPQLEKGRSAGYLGLGLRFQKREGDDGFGFRAVAGFDYWLTSHPIELFMEIVPVFQISPGTDTDLDAGIGMRYYFSGM